MTFVFTDIEGSTALLRRIGDLRFTDVLERHRAIIRSALAACEGSEIKTEGDGFFLAFATDSDAVRFCASAQRALAAEAWPPDVALRVRMGVHGGEADLVNEDYVGLAVHQAARVATAAHGGQTLITQAVLDGVSLGDDVAASPLGRFRLKDFPEPLALFELRGPGMSDGFPAIRAVPAAAHNLPLILSSFVGRDRELSELAELVRHHRVVTVTGAGGTGKTRLAFEVTGMLAGDFADGAWVVLLAALEDPDGVPARIAQVVGAREEPGVSIVETLQRHLGGRPALLVVDNCEHLVESAAEIVGKLLATCPDLTVLATSREPLRLSGEHVWRLPPLSLPGNAASDPAALEKIDAVRLFVERAQSCRPDFALNDQTARAVVTICQQLDGIPLAIELAAARLRHLAVDDIAARLGDRLRLLTGGDRDALPRHRTLRAAVDWSHDSLSEPERVLFRRLCVFRSRFSLDAAEQVCADALLPQAEVLDRIADLVDKSLLSVADDDFGLRYRMLAVLSDYAAEQLASAGEVAAIHQRHAEYFTASEVVQTFAAHIPPTAELVELARLSQDDLRSAFDFATAHDKDSMAAQLAVAWSRYAFLTARYREARGWCDRTLALLAPGTERAEALYMADLLALCDRDFANAESHATELLDYATQAHDPIGRFRSYHTLGDIALCRKDLALAREHYLAALREPGPTPTAHPVVRRSLGKVAGLSGDVAEEEAVYRRVLTEVTQLGRSFEMARTGVDLGWLLASRGATEATGVLRDAWRNAERAKAIGAAVVATAGLGVLAASLGRPGAAVRLVAAADAYGRRHDSSLQTSLGDYFALDAVLERVLIDCRASMTTEAYEEAWRAGLASDPTLLYEEIFGSANAVSAEPPA